MMHINSLVSKLNLKDPWSAITHGIAMLLAIAGTAPLLLRAASGEMLRFISRHWQFLSSL